MPNSEEKITQNQTDEHHILHISNTQFVGNHAYYAGGVLYIRYYETKQIEWVTRQVFIQNCIFSSNTAQSSGYGTVMVVYKVKRLEFTSLDFPQFELIIHNCTFHNNSLLHDKSDFFVGATVNIFSIEKIILRDCNFTKNNSTALSLFGSNVILEGKILFDGNHAMNGGGLRFCETSRMYIRNNTHIKFYNNHAEYAGGAIYVQQQCLEAVLPCFFQLDIPNFTNITDLEKWMSLTFVNNTAEYAGSVLYGGTINFCYTYLRFKYHGRSSYYYSSRIFNEVFDVTQQHGNSCISSDPFGVCLRNESGYFNCSIKNYT